MVILATKPWCVFFLCSPKGGRFLVNGCRMWKIIGNVWLNFLCIFGVFRLYVSAWWLVGCHHFNWQYTGCHRKLVIKRYFGTDGLEENRNFAGMEQLLIEIKTLQQRTTLFFSGLRWGITRKVTKKGPSP